MVLLLSFDIADKLIIDMSDDVPLENKLLLSSDIRLKAEKFSRKVIVDKFTVCEDSSSNQTRDWYNKVCPYLSETEKAIIDDVNLITLKNIHLNAFMFEPLIDISSWVLIWLYTEVKNLV